MRRIRPQQKAWEHDLQVAVRSFIWMACDDLPRERRNFISEQVFTILRSALAEVRKDEQ